MRPDTIVQTARAETISVLSLNNYAFSAIGSKSVSWKVSDQKKSFLRSESFRRGSSDKCATRDQPTWNNCRKMAPGSAKRRRMTPRLCSPISIPTSTFSVSSGSNKTIQSESGSSEKGREIFRKKAKNRLRFMLPSKFSNFNSTDLEHSKASHRPPTKKNTFSETATKIVTADSERRRIYFINGVKSTSYRRPSVQFTDDDTASVLSKFSSERRFSEPILPSLAVGNGGPKFAVAVGSLSASTSAPATIASNDEESVKEAEKNSAGYLIRDWKSDILSRYSANQPWIPKFRTNRYFPKHRNLQDMHCRNPYVVTGCILYNVSSSQ
ncbi:unnamed protein product [Clavelina lepadiformis]|uniref:Uncharacterized protein n=1 Tax=Clavelina lepadiformis TaxID=159417 RepID=A0ABP0GSC3_CLALP